MTVEEPRGSRKLQRATREDVAFRVLCAGNEPDFRTLSEFRRRHLEALAGLFAEVLQLCREAGLAFARSTATCVVFIGLLLLVAFTGR